MLKITRLTIGATLVVALGGIVDAAQAKPKPPTDNYNSKTNNAILIQYIRRSGVNVAMPKLEYDPNVIFDPNGARSMKVVGVVQNTGKMQVIIQARKSSTVEFVSVGSFLNNGQTLVKRVDKIDSAEPLITFEEDGIEIQRRVGENPVE